MGKLKTSLFLTGIFSDLDGKFISFKMNSGLKESRISG